MTNLSTRLTQQLQEIISQAHKASLKCEQCKGTGLIEEPPCSFAFTCDVCGGESAHHCSGTTLVPRLAKALLLAVERLNQMHEASHGMASHNPKLCSACCLVSEIATLMNGQEGGDGTL